MISTELLINVIVVGIITIVFGCMLGLTITRVIDKRLADISIKMPKIIIPEKGFLPEYGYEDPQTLYEPFDHKDTSSKSELPSSIQSNQSSLLKKTNTHVMSPISDVKKKQHSETPPSVPKLQENPQQQQQQQQQQRQRQSTLRTFASKPQQISLPAVMTHTVTIIPNPRKPKQSIQMAKNIEQKSQQSKPNSENQIIGCTSDKDCNVVYGNGQNKCLADHQCYCAKGSGQFCHYGPTYYKDPKNMTDEQRRKFKLKAKVYKMTVQDYINWLSLFEDEQELLSPRDLLNLQKLLKGMSLTDTDVPREEIPPPLTAEQYFDQLYALDSQLNPQNTDTAGLQLPANYMNYSQYENPRNLKHLDEHDQMEALHKYQNREVLDKTQWKISHDYHN